MANPTEGTHRMSIRRKMPAAREVVYEAWIDPQGIREWLDANVDGIGHRRDTGYALERGISPQVV